MCHSPRRISNNNCRLACITSSWVVARVDINTRADDVISPCCGAAARLVVSFPIIAHRFVVCCIMAIVGLGTKLLRALWLSFVALWKDEKAKSARGHHFYEQRSHRRGPVKQPAKEAMNRRSKQAKYKFAWHLVGNMWYVMCTDQSCTDSTLQYWESPDKS
jgi:hypothetical protein